MEIREILAPKGDEVITVDGRASTATAASIMARRRIGALVVSADGSHLDGLVRESEIVAAVAQGGGSLGTATVADIMLTDVATCAPTDHVKAVMELMTGTRSRHLPVVDDGRICGLVSVGDLVRFRMEEVELEMRVLRDAYTARR